MCKTPDIPKPKPAPPPAPIIDQEAPNRVKKKDTTKGTSKYRAGSSSLTIGGGLDKGKGSGVGIGS